jgi:hypothetical protein
MLVSFYASGNEVHDRVISAMYDGCPYQKTIVDDFAYVESDIAVVFGVYKSKVSASWPRGRIIQKHRSLGKDVVVLETGYLNRGDGEEHHYAAGFNGLNGRADFKNMGMPPDRALKLGIEPKPVRTGEKILLCGQVPQDASVDHIDIVRWLHAARNEIKARTKREIVFKPHPKGKIPPINGCGFTKVPFLEALENCHSVVTFNSNSAVEAAVEGVPVFAFDEGSMAWSIANRDWDAIEQPRIPDRKQWLYDLCYAQWDLREMRNGEPWRHLFPTLQSS